MNHYRNTVSRQPHIKFNPIGTFVQSAREGCERVFRSDRGGTTVANNKRPTRIQISEKSGN